MTKSKRPYHRAKTDKNHDIVPKALKNWGGAFRLDEFGVYTGYVRGIVVAAYDMSKLGGAVVDWMVAVSWLVVAFEVKTPRPPAVGRTKGKRGGSEQKLSDHEYYWSMLKPGERSFFLHSPMIKFIVTKEEDVWIKIIDAVNFVEWVDSIPSPTPSFLNLFFPKIRSEDNDEQFNSTFER